MGCKESNQTNKQFLHKNQIKYCVKVKPVLSCHSKRRAKLGFQDLLSLNAGQKYCRMLQNMKVRPLLKDPGKIESYMIFRRTRVMLEQTPTFSVLCIKTAILYKAHQEKTSSGFTATLSSDTGTRSYLIRLASER